MLASLCVIVVITAGIIFIPKIDFNMNNKAEPSSVSTVGNGGLSSNVTVRPAATNTDSLEPQPTEEGNYDKVLIMSAGDIIIQEQQLAAAKTDDGTYDFTDSFSPLAAYISRADLALANLEGVLAGEGNYSGTIKYGYPDELVTALKNTGFDALTAANEHIFDFGEAGARRTAEQIRRQGLEFCGVSFSENEKPYIISNINGIKIAVAAFSYSFDDTLGFPSYMTVDYKADSMADVIKAAKQEGAEVVVVQMHWGNDNEEKASEETKTIAQKLLDAGADIIFGSNPHVVQELQRKTVTDEDGNEREAFIAYSLGNLISAQRQGGRDYGIIAGVEILRDKESGKISMGQTSYAPIWVQNKDSAGNDCYRVLMAGAYAEMEASPNDISPTDFDRIKAVWTEVTEKLGSIKAQPVRGTMQ